MFNSVLLIYKNLISTNFNFIKIWNWYKLYYINYIFSKNIIKGKEISFEKQNIITINLRSKQTRISIISSKLTIFNLTVGKVLSSLNLKNKSKKKSNKGERLFLEYLINFLINNTNKFGLNRLATIKIIGFKKGTTINELFMKLFNKNFNLTSIIYDFKIANNYSKFKKIRSIKRRLRKRIIKNENLLKNNF